MAGFGRNSGPDRRAKRLSPILLTPVCPENRKLQRFSSQYVGANPLVRELELNQPGLVLLTISPFDEKILILSR
jgi:hypothetical protein